ncbi:MAG: hypothetical protein M1840_003615 [Geoglossum simile]|nr:MAG: hypothetical protein M1840_003615 [Geoglossum simile]
MPPTNSAWIWRHRVEVMGTAQKEASTAQRIQHARDVPVLGVVGQPSSAGILMLPVADCGLSYFFSKCTDATDRLMLLTRWLACLSGILVYIHSQGAQARISNPTDILVQGDWDYYTDFGLAKDLDPEAEIMTEE